MKISIKKEEYDFSTHYAQPYCCRAMPYCVDHERISEYTLVIGDAMVHLCQKCVDGLYQELKKHASENAVCEYEEKDKYGIRLCVLRPNQFLESNKEVCSKDGGKPCEWGYDHK